MTRIRASRGWNHETPAWTGQTSPLPALSPRVGAGHSAAHAANQAQHYYPAQSSLRVANGDKLHHRKLGSTALLSASLWLRAPLRTIWRPTVTLPEISSLKWLELFTDCEFLDLKKLPLGTDFFKTQCASKPKLGASWRFGDRHPCTELGNIPKSSPACSNPESLINFTLRGLVLLLHNSANVKRYLQ